jgi:phage shock protein A
MTEGEPQPPLDARLRHELNNAMAVVLSSAELIDRHAGENAAVHTAVDRIRKAVGRSKTTVEDVTRELEQLAARLSAVARK